MLSLVLVPPMVISQTVANVLQTIASPLAPCDITETVATPVAITSSAATSLAVVGVPAKPLESSNNS